VSEVTTYRCDVCGKLKQEANNWFRAIASLAPTFGIVTWDAPLQRPSGELHLCGMECAQKAMAKAMQEGK